MTLLGALAGPGAAVQPGPNSLCPPGPPPDPSTVLLGYIAPPRVIEGHALGAFRALAELRDGKLLPTDGAFLRDGMTFWPLPFHGAPPISLGNVGAVVDRVGPDQCVFHAHVAGAPPPVWTLLASAPREDLLRAPMASDRESFERLNDTCIVQGDAPTGATDCTDPELLAVSDVDSNGRAEYWATKPYAWDTGITVWELGTDGKLVVRLAACSGCSD